MLLFFIISSGCVEPSCVVWYYMLCTYSSNEGEVLFSLTLTCFSFRTAKDNPPVTFAIAACETQNVNVTVLPCFGLSEGSCITAKDMWGKMVQVMVFTIWML